MHCIKYEAMCMIYNSCLRLFGSERYEGGGGSEGVKSKEVGNI